MLLRGPARRRPAPAGLAAAVRRAGRQGLPVPRLGLDQHERPRPGYRWLLIRRTPRTGELAFYRCYASYRVPLATLVKVAGRRWTVEENFQAGKGLTGLDEHQVRRWTSWYRWVTLAMLASAFLAIAAASEHARQPAPPGQIPLTRNEIAHLLASLTSPARDTRHRLRWSRWRRRHQHRAQACHREVFA